MRQRLRRKKTRREELGVESKERVREMICMKLKLCSRYKYPSLLFSLCLLYISRVKKLNCHAGSLH